MHDSEQPTSGQAGAEIEITPEMIEAGLLVLVESGRLFTDYEMSGDRILVQEVFSTMLSARSDEMRR